MSKMARLLRTLLLSVFLVFLTETCVSSLLFNSELDVHWENFKVAYQRKYEHTEEGARRFIWEKNVQIILKHNLEADMGNHTYWLGINQFADMTNEEMKQMRRCIIKGHVPQNETKTFPDVINFELPPSVDWRKKGYVTPIKDQGNCGSCWAFSTTGSLEAQHRAKTGTLVSLSEQNLVDCSRREGNDGCNGGWMDYAFQYIMKNKGIDTEKSYPYVGKNGRCKFNRSTVGATIRGFVDLPKGNETSLQAATALVGPISVAIDASSNKFMFYKHGIYTDKQCTTTNLDHAVLVVGYGTNSQSGVDYWLVKNSWGTSWGVQGYIYMARNAQNQCGIASKASYPLV